MDHSAAAVPMNARDAEDEAALVADVGRLRVSHRAAPLSSALGFAISKKDRALRDCSSSGAGKLHAVGKPPLAPRRRATAVHFVGEAQPSVCIPALQNTSPDFRQKRLACDAGEGAALRHERDASS